MIGAVLSLIPSHTRPQTPLYITSTNPSRELQPPDRRTDKHTDIHTDHATHKHADMHTDHATCVAM